MKIENNVLFADSQRAQGIVDQAIQDLKEVLNDEVKATMRSAKDAANELCNINKQIFTAKHELEVQTSLLNEMKRRVETAREDEIPNLYIRNFVHRNTKGLAPGDKAWFIVSEPSWAPCAKCGGKGRVKALLDGKETSFRCPICEGRKETMVTSWTIKESTVKEVKLSLSFKNNRMFNWDMDTLLLEGHHHRLPAAFVYATREEAEEARERIKKESLHVEDDLTHD